MEFLYIDESGTMTTSHSNDFPYFLIAVLRVFDSKSLKRKIKHFVSKHYEELKVSDTEGKMFKDGEFQELKGSSLTPFLKIALANYLMGCSNLFQIDIITIQNKKVKPETYENTARAFNYFLDLFITYKVRKGEYPCDEYLLQIDERNVKNDARRSLEDYLSIELCLKQELIKKATVSYFDSCNNSLIQLSDFFSNLYYSYLMKPKNYGPLIKKLKTNGVLKNGFVFPIS